MTYIAKTIGLLRFSVLTPTYYSERFDTLDETAAHLFSAERMALRFRLFETLCLPSLVEQTDPDFECVVLTAERMPDEYKDRLRALLDPIPHIHLRAVGTDNHYQLLKGGYDSINTGDATHRILFRLDDDDCVDLNFIARTKRMAAGAVGAQPENAPIAIAHNRGFYVRVTGGGNNEVFDACERAPLSTGTSVVAPVGFPKNPYRYVHRALPQHFTTFSDLSVPAFIRTIHNDNKSNPTQIGITHKLKPGRIERLVNENFPVALDVLKAL